MSNQSRPNARPDNLIVQELENETLVYDLNSNKAHCLNEPAAFIWSQCDGKSSIDQIAKAVGQKFGGGSVSEDYVLVAIDQLSDNDLLEKSSLNVANVFNRRDAIRRMGLSAIAIPVVASLLAPITAAQMGSCVCGNSGDCLVQTTCPSTANCNQFNMCAP